MTIRLLIKRPHPVHAEEYDRAYRQDASCLAAAEIGSYNDADSASIAPSTCRLPSVVYSSIDKVSEAFESALAHAVAIGSAGAVTILAVHDNAR